LFHQLTALSSSIDMRHFDRDLELTTRLRTEGTDHLLAAGHAIGVKRFVAQSFAGQPFARSGSIPRHLTGCAAVSRPFATWRRR
jgi:2-alkyl-3-oxoalkanoate reductase